ncbi:MAG: hypothetical protein CSA81_09405 [Acidobacteria bacterium]|nr:MAG: hypothetical protein CSA81_09405 [Acidobacteriota bacterium]
MKHVIKSIAVTLILLSLLACGKPELSETLTQEDQAAWDWIKQTQPVLNQKRAELTELAKKVEAANIPGAVQEEGAATKEELDAQLKALEDEVEKLQTDYTGKLVNFINAMEEEIFEIHKKNPEATKRPEHVEASSMMSDEDILAANQWVLKQGDYKQAINHIKGVLEFDPENQKLVDFLNKLNTDRWMTPEKLAKVQNNMTEGEVRAQIGQVYHQNIQTWEEDGIHTKAWFYPREDHGIAGVYFILGKDQIYTVFKVNYDAKKPKGQEEEKPAE